jgi:hypothetical protein
VLRYAQSVGAKHFNTSAKLDKGITELFVDLTRSTNHISPLHLFHILYLASDLCIDYALLHIYQYEFVSLGMVEKDNRENLKATPNTKSKLIVTDDTNGPQQQGGCCGK